MSLNKFEQALEVDAAKFASAVKGGIGWIAENDILRQFFGMFPEYDVTIFDEDVIKNYLEEYFYDNGIDVFEGDGPEEEF